MAKRPPVLERWFALPTLPTEEQTQAARMFHRVAWMNIGVIATLMGLLILNEPTSLLRRTMTVVIVVVTSLALLELSGRGRTRLASWLFVAVLLELVTQRALTSGGLTAPASAGFVTIVLVAGTLLGSRGGAIVAMVSAGAGYAMLRLEQVGALPPSEIRFTLLSAWLTGCLWLGMAVVLQVQVAAALRDALGRTTAELRERREAQQHLRLALGAAKIAVWSQDPETRRFSADARLYEAYGLSPEADGTIAYEAWSARLHPQDRAAAEAMFRRLGSGTSEVSVEFRVLRPDGAVRNVEAAAALVTDERQRPVRIVGVTVDVSDRMQAERERAILVHDLKERVKELALLHAAARLLYPQRPADRGLLQELVDLVPAAWQFPECCAARIGYRDIVVATPGWRDSPYRQSTRFETSDGNGVIEVVYLEERPPAALGPFLEEEQTLLESLADMLVGFLELRKHQEHLQALVEMRTRELRAATEEADRANRAKSAFLAHMSHEIRTPLNAVLGYAQLLRRDGSLDDEQRRKVGVILASGDHLLALINDVLEMSKIEAGRTMLVEEPLDLHALLEGIRQMLEGSARARGLEVMFELSDVLPHVVIGDVSKIRQVVINMVSNALKFTAEGRVRLRASSEPAGAQGHRIEIVVEDTGAGIDTSDLGRVFEPFEQTDAGKRAGGSGLGLPISRQFARLMGGDLTVESRPGKGSTFTFSFRAGGVAANAQVPTQRPLPVGLAAGQTPRKIMIVDDVATNREMLAELLGSMGYETQAAASGEEALHAHSVWQPDLVLMDLRMAGMDGLEATRRLRAAGSKAVVIAMSASSAADMDDEARQAGADHFVRKPYRESELLEKIGAALGVRYTYAAFDGNPASMESDLEAAASSLSTLASRLPADLIEKLRRAALEARAQRIDELADQIGAHSKAAAAHIRALAESFRYDALLGALQPGGLR